MARPQVADEGKASNTDANILTKQSRTADNRLSSRFGFRRGDKNSLPYKRILLRNIHTVIHIIYNNTTACQPNPAQPNPTNTLTISTHKNHFNNTLSSLSLYCQCHFHPSCFSFSHLYFKHSPTQHFGFKNSHNANNSIQIRIQNPSKWTCA
jgi:hypothetical protein